MGAKKQQRIVDALNVLAKDAPELFGSIVNVDCPHEAGFTEPNAGKCGFNDTENALVIGYCEECWRLAMGGKP